MMRQDTGTPATLGLTIRVDSRRSELVRGFLDSCRTDVLRIRTAMVMADYETIEDLGHRMRCVAGSLEFDLVTEISDAIENAAKSRDEPSLREQFNMLRNFLDHVDLVVG